MKRQKYFISYSMADKIITLDLLKKLRKRLEKDANCYVDILDNDSNNKQARVVAELLDSDKLILVNTPNCKKSKWVQLELSIAKNNGIGIHILNIDSITGL